MENIKFYTLVCLCSCFIQFVHLQGQTVHLEVVKQDDHYKCKLVDSKINVTESLRIEIFTKLNEFVFYEKNARCSVNNYENKSDNKHDGHDGDWQGLRICSKPGGSRVKCEVNAETTNYNETKNLNLQCESFSVPPLKEKTKKFESKNVPIMQVSVLYENGKFSCKKNFPNVSLPTTFFVNFTTPMDGTKIIKSECTEKTIESTRVIGHKDSLIIFENVGNFRQSQFSCKLIIKGPLLNSDSKTTICEFEVASINEIEPAKDPINYLWIYIGTGIGACIILISLFIYFGRKYTIFVSCRKRAPSCNNIRKFVGMETKSQNDTDRYSAAPSKKDPEAENNIYECLDDFDMSRNSTYIKFRPPMPLPTDEENSRNVPNGDRGLPIIPVHAMTIKKPNIIVNELQRVLKSRNIANEDSGDLIAEEAKDYPNNASDEEWTYEPLADAKKYLRK